VTLILAVSLAAVLIVAVFLAALAWHIATWCVRQDAEMRGLRDRLHQLEAPDREVPLPGQVSR
jgi:hypothetical protein